jgi:hypothetical protein
MIVSAQSLALFLEQDYGQWNQLKRARAVEHILTASDEVRGALATMYTIPQFTRDANGAITGPILSGGTTPVADPHRSGLGPIVKMLAAASLLDPSRGFQPQEDRSAAAEYAIRARAQLNALASVKNGALIAAIAALPGFGIIPSPGLIATVNTERARALPGIRQAKPGLTGTLHDPSTGLTLEELNNGA